MYMRDRKRSDAGSCNGKSATREFPMSKRKSRNVRSKGKFTAVSCVKMPWSPASEKGRWKRGMSEAQRKLCDDRYGTGELLILGGRPAAE